MRVHPRRVLTYSFVGVCLVIVLLNIQLNTRPVTREEMDMFLLAHQQHDVRLGGLGHDDLGHPRIRVNQGMNHSVHYNQRYIHVKDGKPLDFVRLVAAVDPWDDRILRQMEYVPMTYKYNVMDRARVVVAEGEDPADSGLKVIYAPGGLGDVPHGQEVFLTEECPVDRCFLTDAARHEENSHAHVIQSEGYAGELLNKKPPGQIWILWALESPLNTPPYTDLKGHINWTATYRADSTIVTPYERFVPYGKPVPSSNKNYAMGKTKMVAWFVSNCGARNKRMEYAEQLGLYVKVDIYGACGDFICARDDTDRCNSILDKEYKFYLSFENSNCDYYITEKFFWNGLKNDVVPIVMGGRKEDYTRVAPPHSFIHVEDFKSAKELSDYLIKLDQNDALYNEYFRWKGTGHFINTKFWCRVCAMLYDDTQTTVWYDDIEKWWRQNETCTEDRWDNPSQLISDWEKAAWTFD